MKCIKCGHVVEQEALRTIDAELKGEHVSVTLHAPQCMHCGRVVILGRHTRAYHRAVSDAYRRKVGLLTIGEIDRLRRNLAMTWPDFADYLSIGTATLKRWRRGEIQTPALDRLVRRSRSSSVSRMRPHSSQISASVAAVCPGLTTKSTITAAATKTPNTTPTAAGMSEMNDEMEPIAEASSTDRMTVSHHMNRSVRIL